MALPFFMSPCAWSLIIASAAAACHTLLMPLRHAYDVTLIRCHIRQLTPVCCHFRMLLLCRCYADVIFAAFAADDAADERRRC